ncbi:centromere protein V-like [Apostichopus japonicus]|uniref:centromere protein V-like n=1 Tax=Stichopus japonicus TaxID=307972 RepID=UPI003AB16B07
MSIELIKHCGGCHCGRVRFEVLAPEILEVMDCNCSICTKKQNRHIIVPEGNFKLLKGEDSLTVYTFGTGVAKHTFCKVCGVQSFYSPRSNPDGKGIAVHCLDSGTVKGTKLHTFDGQNWEKSMKEDDLSNMSKP